MGDYQSLFHAHRRPVNLTRVAWEAEAWGGCARPCTRSQLSARQVTSPPSSLQGKWDVCTCSSFSGTHFLLLASVHIFSSCSRHKTADLPIAGSSYQARRPALTWKDHMPGSVQIVKLMLNSEVGCLMFLLGQKLDRSFPVRNKQSGVNI